MAKVGAHLTKEQIQELSEQFESVSFLFRDCFFGTREAEDVFLRARVSDCWWVCRWTTNLSASFGRVCWVSLPRAGHCWRLLLFFERVGTVFSRPDAWGETGVTTTQDCGAVLVKKEFSVQWWCQWLAGMSTGQVPTDSNCFLSKKISSLYEIPSKNGKKKSNRFSSKVLRSHVIFWIGNEQERFFLRFRFEFTGNFIFFNFLKNEIFFFIFLFFKKNFSSEKIWNFLHSLSSSKNFIYRFCGEIVYIEIYFTMGGGGRELVFVSKNSLKFFPIWTALICLNCRQSNVISAEQSPHSY